MYSFFFTWFVLGILIWFTFYIICIIRGLNFILLTCISLILGGGTSGVSHFDVYFLYLYMGHKLVISHKENQV